MSVQALEAAQIPGFQGPLHTVIRAGAHDGPAGVDVHVFGHVQHAPSNVHDILIVADAIGPDLIISDARPAAVRAYHSVLHCGDNEQGPEPQISLDGAQVSPCMSLAERMRWPLLVLAAACPLDLPAPPEPPANASKRKIKRVMARATLPLYPLDVLPLADPDGELVRGIAAAAAAAQHAEVPQALDPLSSSSVSAMIKRGEDAVFLRMMLTGWPRLTEDLGAALAALLREQPLHSAMPPAWATQAFNARFDVVRRLGDVLPGLTVQDPGEAAEQQDGAEVDVAAVGTPAAAEATLRRLQQLGLAAADGCSSPLILSGLMASAAASGGGELAWWEQPGVEQRMRRMGVQERAALKAADELLNQGEEDDSLAAVATVLLRSLPQDLQDALRGATPTQQAPQAEPEQDGRWRCDRHAGAPERPRLFTPARNVRLRNVITRGQAAAERLTAMAPATEDKGKIAWVGAPSSPGADEPSGEGSVYVVARRTPVPSSFALQWAVEQGEQLSGLLATPAELCRESAVRRPRWSAHTCAHRRFHEHCLVTEVLLHAQREALDGDGGGGGGGDSTRVLLVVSRGLVEGVRAQLQRGEAVAGSPA